MRWQGTPPRPSAFSFRPLEADHVDRIKRGQLLPASTASAQHQSDVHGKLE
jgi:hypothetical protein